MKSMMTTIRAGFVIGLLASVLASRGLAGDSLTFYGFDPSTLSAASKEGMEAIFSGKCFHNGTPLAAIRNMVKAMPGESQLGYAPASAEGRFYALGRLPSPPERMAGMEEGLSLGDSAFERDGVTLMNGNCFSCHAGVAHGQVVAGLGNSHFFMPEGGRRATRGDHFGPYAVWRFISRLEDPAKEGLVAASKKTQLEDLLDSLELAPVDPMPWWLMKYKKRDYWYADGAPDDAAHFSINFTTAHAEMNAHRGEHIQTVAKALAFARETTSPPFPGKLNADLVARGAELFHGRTRPADTTGFVACKTCHGTYTRKDAAADLSQPGGWQVDYRFSDVLRNVKTDDAYNRVLQQLVPLVEHQRKLATYYATVGTPEFTPQVSVPNKPGYIAPPLVGVWATAPYFHNGSVPTITAVLNSPTRPEIWSREHRDPHAYDLEKVGMQHQVLTRSQLDESQQAAKGKHFLSQPAIDRTAIYDTQSYGHHNTGHTFGDHLTDAERSAIIEFLKSLSGPDM